MAKQLKRGSPEAGSRGPRKTPTALLKATGAGNDKRRQGLFQEPIPLLGVPAIPAHVEKLMTEKAREHWDAVSVVLDRMGVLGDIDAHVIARYCITFANWYDCQLFINENGQTYESEASHGGSTVYKPYPEAAMAAKYGEQMLKVEREFGMTASSRASVDVQKQNNKLVSSAEKYLQKNA